MTDTITLPSGLETYEGRVLVIPGRGTTMPAGDLTAAEATALRADVAAAMNQDLGDLANVTEAGKSDGLVLTVQSDGNWAPESPSIGISRVHDWAVELPGAPFDAIQTVAPIRAAVHPTVNNRARLSIDIGKTADTVASGNHTHPPTLKGRVSFNKEAAVLGAGISPLVDTTITGLVSTVVYDVDIRGTLEAVNTNASGRLRLYTQIGAFVEEFQSRGFSGGVWTEASTGGVRMGITGVTSLRLQFWAEYQSGDPTALYTGLLVYRLDPRGGQ